MKRFATSKPSRASPVLVNLRVDKLAANSALCVVVSSVAFRTTQKSMFVRFAKPMFGDAFVRSGQIATDC